MKKTAVLVMMLLLAACGQNTSEDSEQASPSESAAVSQEASRSATEPAQSGAGIAVMPEVTDPYQEWAAGLDNDQIGGAYFEGETLYITVLDPETFAQSEAMQFAEELNLAIELVQVDYSWNQLLAAQAALLEGSDDYGIVLISIDTMTNSLMLDVLDGSEEVRAAIIAACGIENITLTKTASVENPVT